jgi:predicted O-methyltransferase YrrM
MNFELLIPYAKRLATKLNTKLKVLLLAHKGKDVSDFWTSKDFVEVVDTNTSTDNIDHSKYHIVLIDYNKMKNHDVVINAWKCLNTNGYIAIQATDHNKGIAREFRKDEKITSPVTIFDDFMFFQKEDYSDRHRQEPVIIMKEFEEVQRPDWSGSHLKQAYLDKYAHGDIFVETGTYLGQTVELVRLSTRHFRKIFSVELDKTLAETAKNMFKSDTRINIVEGDSVDAIKSIASTEGVENPITFWLDAHASGPLVGGKTGPCPLREELKAIKETGRIDHTIFIDDRRLFGSAEWGGVSEKEIMDLLSEINPNYTIIHLNGEQPNDIICATVVDNSEVITAVNAVANDLTKGNKLLSKQLNVPVVEEELPLDIRKYFLLDQPRKAASANPFLRPGETRQRRFILE